MSVPDVAVAGALLTIARSATRWAVVVAIDELLVALMSSARLEAVTVAVFSLVLRRARWSTLFPYTTLFRSRASVPKLQVTVPAVLMHPALAETKLTWARSEERRVGKEGRAGPLLVPVRKKVMSVPDVAVAGALLTIARSAMR